MAKAPPKSGGGKKSSHGIAEWYGFLFRNIEPQRRAGFLEPESKPACPFLASVPDLAPGGKTACSKAGGVCSLRSFTQTADLEIEYGPITATCPNRFLEGRIVVEHIGRLLLDTDRPLIAKEIPFLRRPADDADKDLKAADGHDDVGKIDMVFMHPDKEPKEWCAAEIQAVYFSGKSMTGDFAAIRNHTGNSMPFPSGQRRPDFRSSGPKRLMPQLQIKVPSLRRWGKKMVVIIDRPFLDAMARMAVVDHISNCDIVWVVVNFEENAAGEHSKLFVEKVLYTTLEDSVVGLTAGVPATLPEFEAKLATKIRRPS